MSVKMLDIIQSVLIQEKYKCARIDGTVSKLEERQQVIDAFTRDPSYFCFLLTTQVGGLGLNLVSADRVIICTCVRRRNLIISVDPAWNALDEQAVDRVYRIGQDKNVIIYRFITCGTIEEKIYRKQVHKRSLTKTTLVNYGFILATNLSKGKRAETPSLLYED